MKKIIRIVWVLIIILTVIATYLVGTIKGEGQNVEVKSETATTSSTTEVLSKPENNTTEKRIKKVETQEVEIQNGTSTCEQTLKELKIKNTCEETKKIISEFDYDKTIVATLIHESSFDRSAVGVNKDGSTDVDFAQINTVIWSQKNRNLNQGLYYNGDLEMSIKIAKLCYKLHGYSCWAAFDNGSYKKHLLTAEKLIETLKNYE